MKCLLSMVILGIVIVGCAEKGAMDKYYAVETQRLRLLLSSSESQASSNRINRAQEMQFYANASSNAARTASDADDVLVAFAWGYRMGQPDRIQLPNLPPLKAPPTDVDYIRAYTPWIGMFMPFAYMAAAGWSDSGDSVKNTYQVADNGRVNVASQNPGSGNTVGRDNYVTSANPDNANTTCTDCDDDGLGLGTDGGLDADSEGFDLITCRQNPPSGYNDLGTPMWDANTSCGSYSKAQ